MVIWQIQKTKPSNDDPYFGYMNVLDTNTLIMIIIDLKNQKKINQTFFRCALFGICLTIFFVNHMMMMMIIGFIFIYSNGIGQMFFFGFVFILLQTKPCFIFLLVFLLVKWIFFCVSFVFSFRKHHHHSNNEHDVQAYI